MSGFTLPWPMWPFLAYLVVPWFAFGGAVLGGGLAWRRTLSLGKSAVWALLGSQLVAWLVLVLVGTWGEHGGATRILGLGFVVVLALSSYVLLTINRARSRRRVGN
jgi:hypothetical protein